jgi:hypothetical protein
MKNIYTREVKAHWVPEFSDSQVVEEIHLVTYIESLKILIFSLFKSNARCLF